MRFLIYLLLTFSLSIAGRGQDFKHSAGIFYPMDVLMYRYKLNTLKFIGLEYKLQSVFGNTSYGIGGFIANENLPLNNNLLITYQYKQLLFSINRDNSIKGIFGFGLKETSILSNNFDKIYFELLTQIGIQIKPKNLPFLFYTTLDPSFYLSNHINLFFNNRLNIRQLRIGLNLTFGKYSATYDESTKDFLSENLNVIIKKKGEEIDMDEGNNFDKLAENESELFWTKNGPANEKTDVFNISDGDLLQDIDGNIYKTMILGEKRWFAENLKVSRYNNGEVINEIESDNIWSEAENGAWSKYNNSDEYERIVGRLYNGYVIIDDRQVCPTGWHIPSNDEWVELINDLGGAKRAISKLKSVNGWLGSFKNSNSSGLKGYPSGARKSDGLFDGAGKLLVWWTSTSIEDITKLYCRFITHDKQDFFKSSVNLNNGFAIRCKED